MKKIIWAVVILVILAIIVVSTLKKDSDKAVSESVTVGVLMPLSGSAAYYGEQAKDGVELAKQVMAEKYPDLKVNTIHEDNMFTPKGSIDAYNKVKNTNVIDAVITGTTPTALAVAPLSKADNLLHVATFAVADAYSSPNDLTFRVSTKGATEINYHVDFMKNKGYKKISVIYINNDYGVSIKNSLTDALKTNSIQYTEEGFLPDATDFRAQLLKIKQFAPDAVFVSGVAKNISMIMKQGREIGIQAQFMGIRAAQDPALLEHPASAEGFIYTYPFDPNSATPEINSFVDTFRQKYGKEPDAYAAEGYEAMRLTIEAFAECGKNNDCLKSYLTNLKNEPSIFGPLSFDENGDITYNFFFKTVKNGQFTKLEN